MKAPLAALAAALILVPSLAAAQTALTDPIKEGAVKLAAQIGAESAQRALRSGPDAVIRRTDCDNEIVRVEDATGRTVRSRDTSLETSSSWLVAGRRYDLVYYYSPAAVSQPTPLLGQLVSTESPEGAGTLSATEARMLMRLPGGGFQDVPVHRDTYSELDAGGQATLYLWENGAKGRPLTRATKTTLPDGGMRTVSRGLDQQAVDGWRDGGSVYACTATSMSRAAWLAMSGDPAMTNEISTLDALSYAVGRAEQANSPDLAAQKRAFAAAWENVYSNRKAALQRNIERIERQRRRRRERAAAQRCDGVCAALQAIEAAKEQSARNAQEQMARDLAEMKRELERRR